jgi:hypothetical protein
MGILSTVESTAEGALVGGPAGAAVGAAKGVLKNISLKQVLGIVAGLALLVLIGWAALLNSRLKERDAQIEAAANAVFNVDGKKPSAKDLASYVFKIAAERDEAKAADALKKAALDSQSQTINNLGQISAQQASVSKQNSDLARSLSASRDQWIAQAQANAQRTVPLSDSQELAQCKEAMDALFNNDF